MGRGSESIYVVVRITPTEPMSHLSLRDVIGQAMESVESAPVYYRTIVALRAGNRELSVEEADDLFSALLWVYVKGGWERLGRLLPDDGLTMRS